MKKHAIVALLIVFGLINGIYVGSAQEPVSKAQWELEFQRIKELFRLTDLYGDKIWPGFDLRKVPIGINYNYNQEILINHPNPPDNFRKFEGAQIHGLPVMLRDGCTLYASAGGAININKIRTAYVQVAGDKISTEEYLLTTLHESFHVFQNLIWKRNLKEFKMAPLYDADNSAGVALENTILYNALQEKDEKNITDLVEMFIAVRRKRQSKFPVTVRSYEDWSAFAEGTALYSEVQLCRLLYLDGLGPSPLVPIDSNYKGFSDAGKRYREYLEKILPPEDRMITLGHERYQNGMGQAFLLDRVYPGWKSKMVAKNLTQFDLLKEHFPLNDKRIDQLVETAKKRFDFNAIYNHQEKLVKERLDTIYRCIEAPGRRYRIYYMEDPGRFKWKFIFPVYELPGSDLTENLQKLVIPKGKTVDLNDIEGLIMINGLERLENSNNFLFQSKETPIIQWMGSISYIEWIDGSPAVDSSDMKIQADRIEGDVYTNLQLETGGFSLRVKRAQIVWSTNIVEIHPLPLKNSE